MHPVGVPSGFERAAEAANVAGLITMEIRRAALPCRTAILRWIVCGCLTLPPGIAPAQQALDAAHPQGKWEVLEGCRIVTNSVIDGDSFRVNHKGRAYVFRLYFVDAPEADASLAERIKDQAAYFGSAITNIPRGGKLAAQFTRERLSGHDVTVVTRWQNAMGRGKLARFYCVVLVQGKNLGDELVANGLARIYGLRANWPEGTRSTTIINKLKNLELIAREQRRGLWDEKAFPRMTDSKPVVLAEAKKGNPGTVDVNEASYEALQTLPGVGPKIAERIIANRPYHTVDDLLKVSGIGTSKMEQLRPLVRVEGVATER
jgi:competence ComEA-like helix-hairpin-helix protein